MLASRITFRPASSAPQRFFLGTTAASTSDPRHDHCTTDDGSGSKELSGAQPARRCPAWLVYCLFFCRSAMSVQARLPQFDANVHISPDAWRCIAFRRMSVAAVTLKQVIGVTCCVNNDTFVVHRSAANWSTHLVLLKPNCLLRLASSTGVEVRQRCPCQRVRLQRRVGRHLPASLAVPPLNSNSIVAQMGCFIWW